MCKMFASGAGAVSHQTAVCRPSPSTMSSILRCAGALARNRFKTSTVWAQLTLVAMRPGLALHQHTETIARQSQLDIEGIVPSALAVEKSPPITELSKECAQQPRFGTLSLVLLVSLAMNNLPLFLAQTEVERHKQLVQSEYFDNQLPLESLKVCVWQAKIHTESIYTRSE